MKRYILGICFIMFLVADVGILVASDYGQDGPAPNSGDGISDGSGFDDPKSAGKNSAENPEAPGEGPAPNSGDGIPDGSGFTDSQVVEIDTTVGRMTQELMESGVPETQAKRMLSLMVANRFQEQVMREAAMTIGKAAKNGLPTEPIVSKAIEGMIKNAGEEQIVMAMTRVGERYAYAHETADELGVGERARSRVAQSIADSLAAGMKTADVDAVADRIQTQTRKQTKADDDFCLQVMMTMEVMAQMGVQSQTASEMMQNVVQNQFSVAEMVQLRSRMQHQDINDNAVQAAYRYAGEIGKSTGMANEYGGSNASAGGNDGNSGSSGTSGYGGGDSGGSSGSSGYGGSDSGGSSGSSGYGGGDSGGSSGSSGYGGGDSGGSGGSYGYGDSGGSGGSSGSGGSGSSGGK